MTRATQTKTNLITETEDIDIEVTKATYQRLKRAINRSAERVEDAVDGAEEKEIMALERNLTQHHKVLDNLMKLTGGMDAGQSKSNAVEIDLDAARSEIIERLSRIRATS